MSVLSDDLQTLSYESYVYLYSLVTMEVTRQQQTNSPAGSTPGFGPPNQFHHMRQFPDVEFRASCGRTSTRCTRRPGWI